MRVQSPYTLIVLRFTRLEGERALSLHEDLRREEHVKGSPRLAGKDPLRRRLDPGAKSYWIERIPPVPPPESMKNQF